MARRRRRTGYPPGAVVGVVGLIAIAIVAAHPAFFGISIVLIAGAFIYWKWVRPFLARRRAAEELGRQIDAELGWWAQAQLLPGVCTVSITAIRNGYEQTLRDFLDNLSDNSNFDIDPGRIIRRVQHIGPEPVVVGIDEDMAVQLKTSLESWGARTQIKEGVPAVTVGSDVRRQPIPERVRHEVWRRDGGQCIDCGSQGRLEFDHVIPVSKGGSSTARNLQLWCETCNRKKGATI